jgi:hypothetical protein
MFISHAIIVLTGNVNTCVFNKQTEWFLVMPLFILAC